MRRVPEGEEERAMNRAERCEHGYTKAPAICPECHPELAEPDDDAFVVCVLCESAGHVAKLCNQTEAGRRRRNGRELQA